MLKLFRLPVAHFITAIPVKISRVKSARGTWHYQVRGIHFPRKDITVAFSKLVKGRFDTFSRPTFRYTIIFTEATPPIPDTTLRLLVCSAFIGLAELRAEKTWLLAPHQARAKIGCAYLELGEDAPRDTPPARPSLVRYSAASLSPPQTCINAAALSAP